MLTEDETQEYWEERSNKLGERTVGYGDKSLEQQDGFYKEVSEFIFNIVDGSLSTVDYGCGIGRHSPSFTGTYLGIDMTEQLIRYAMKRNPNKTYICSNNPYISDDIGGIQWIQQFFTATVLQHCDDELVLKILDSVYYQKKTNFIFALYENSHGFKKSHVIGRKPSDYIDFIKKVGFNIGKLQVNTHLNKGEQHSLIKVWV